MVWVDLGILGGLGYLNGLGDLGDLALLTLEQICGNEISKFHKEQLYNQASPPLC